VKVNVEPVTAHEPVAEYVTGSDDVDEPVSATPLGEYVTFAGNVKVTCCAIVADDECVIAGIETPSEFTATTEKATLRATGNESRVQLMAPDKPDVTRQLRPAADTA
jgi:hypothetical protein